MGIVIIGIIIMRGLAPCTLRLCRSAQVFVGIQFRLESARSKYGCQNSFGLKYCGLKARLLGAHYFLQIACPSVGSRS